MNALELTEDLRARTDLSDRDATGIVRIISRAVEDSRSELVTRDHLTAQLAALRGEVKGDIASLRVELHQAVRSQTVWIMPTMLAIAGLVVAGIKLIP